MPKPSSSPRYTTSSTLLAEYDAEKAARMSRNFSFDGVSVPRSALKAAGDLIQGARTGRRVGEVVRLLQPSAEILVHRRGQNLAAVDVGGVLTVGDHVHDEARCRSHAMACLSLLAPPGAIVHDTAGCALYGVGFGPAHHLSLSNDRAVAVSVNCFTIVHVAAESAFNTRAHLLRATKCMRAAFASGILPAFTALLVTWNQVVVLYGARECGRGLRIVRTRPYAIELREDKQDGVHVLAQVLRTLPTHRRRDAPLPMPKYVNATDSDASDSDS